MLAALGTAIAGYLAAFQLHLIPSVWDPLFGDGSRRVLTSSLSRALPAPDALLGAGCYLLEGVLSTVGGPDRSRRRPWLVLLNGAVAAALGLAALALLAAQAFLVGAWCFLCLVSAATSLAIVALSIDEVAAALSAARGLTSR